MDPSQIGVTIGGAAAIAAVLWYFFPDARQRKRTVAAATSTEAGGVQEVRVVVKGGYEPDTIVVEKGRPVRLDFYRDETSSCSDTVIFGDFGISKPLPAFKTTPVEFTPQKTGQFDFTCGMNMLRGRLIVEEPKAG